MTTYEERKAGALTADRQIVAGGRGKRIHGLPGNPGCARLGQAGAEWQLLQSSMQVAYRWIEDAGEEVVYLIPDGPTDVTKSERTGCYPDACSSAYWRTRTRSTPSASLTNGRATWQTASRCHESRKAHVTKN